jgi:O-antigen/teichoic acid export membrane protein
MSSDTGSGPSPQEAGAVGRKVAVGAAFMITGRLVIRLLSVINLLILARLLPPGEFGIVVLASVAFAILETLTAMNYFLALARRPTIDQDVYDSAWTMNILRCLLLGAVVAATADLQAGLLGDARVGPILLVVAAGVALDGLHSVGLIRLQRELRYDAMFRFQVVSRVVAFVVTLALAFWMQNYWCLVLGNIAAKLVTIPYSYWLAPQMPRFSLRHAGELLHFSKWMVAVNACQAVEAQAANLSLGRFAGVQPLGMWSVSYQLAATPVTELAVPVRGPIYAGYAQIQHDRPALQRHFLTGFGLLGAVVTPLSVGIALVAPQLEVLALGPTWAGAAVLIALCAIYALLDCMAHFTGGIFYVLDAQNRLARTYAVLTMLRVAAVVPAAILGGAVGVGVAMLTVSLVSCVVWHWRTAVLLGTGLRDAWVQVWRSLAAASAMAAVVVAVQLSLPPPAGTLMALLELAALAACGAVVHVAAQWVLWRLSGSPDAAERRILTSAAALVGRLRARIGAAPAQRAG